MQNVLVGFAFFLIGAAAALAQPDLVQPKSTMDLPTADHPNIWYRLSSSINPTHLPLGDSKFSNAPKRGYIYPCDPKHYFSIPIGSHTRGPWIRGTTWDFTQKPTVRGSVAWPTAVFTISTIGDSRILAGNGLPVGTRTGIFPIQKDDPAHAFDANPNSIKEQVINVVIPLNPEIAAQPSCLQPQIGFALDGTVFQFALSSMMGHDEIAYEMQDACGGMSDPAGIYHRHALSPCIPRINERNALVGYALDGFGIFSPYDAMGNELTTQDLDECHGTTSPISWDGKEVTMYHYVLTRDYPYTIGCFRGTPSYVPLPPPPLIARIMSFFIITWQNITSVSGH
jgi:hypothetical protein